MQSINQFQSLDCQLGDPYDPTLKIVVQSRQEKDDFLLPKICKQIEFYMGDANLQHDNYFKRILKQNQNWIPLETFLNCNKIKSLMQNYPNGLKQQIAILAYSLQRSEILIVQDDRVKRKIPFDEDSTYMDHRTIYVENIPKKVDEQLLHKIFSRIDNQVLKIKKLQSYAFITFLNIESVNKAIQYCSNLVPKEIIEQGSGLRVMSKLDWLQYKQQCKSYKRKQQQHTEEPVTIKLAFIQTQDLQIEELRIAIGHAVPQNQVKHITLQNDICLLDCTKTAAKNIQKNIHRIQNYDDRFQNCQVS